MRPTLPISLLLLAGCPTPPQIDTDAIYAEGVADGKDEALAGIDAILEEKMAGYVTEDALRLAIAEHAGERDDPQDAAIAALEAELDAAITTQAAVDAQQDTTVSAAVSDAIAAAAAAQAATDANQDAALAVAAAAQAATDSDQDAALAAAVSAQASVDAAQDAAVTALDADLAALDADLAALDARVTATEALRVDADREINVPADYATLDEALDALAHVTIAPGATVTILLASGTYTHTSPVTFSHPQGDRVEIVGDGLGAELVFSGCDGFVLTEGATLGYLDNVIVTTDGPGYATGIYVTTNSVVELGPLVEVSGFYEGIVAELGGVVYAANVTLADNTHGGIQAEYGGLVYAGGASVSGSTPTGMRAEYGGGIVADSASVSASSGAYVGFGAYYGGWLSASSATSDGPTSIGAFRALDNGTIIADNSSVTSTGGYGYSYVGTDASVLSLQGATASSGSPCLAHSGSVLHVNGGTTCQTAHPSAVSEPYGSTNPSGSVISW